MRLKEFIQKKEWKKWDKSQWAILILAGVLLMVIAVPAEGLRKEEDTAKQDIAGESGIETNREDYADGLERRLEDVLSRIDGAGRGKVMVTLEDSGESIVEKDTVVEAEHMQEADREGGSRTQKNTQTTNQSVYSEASGEKNPFVGKEMAPKIAGVLIVAQGGENTAVKQNISEAVMALFQIDVNRIKVVKMNIQEEEY